MKATRRELLAALAGSTAVAAQTVPEKPAPDDLTVQREQIRKNAQAIASVEMPVTLEPAFVFKA